jgi:hypothetical protein
LPIFVMLPNRNTIFQFRSMRWRGKGIRVFTKSSEIGIWAWPPSGSSPKKAYCSWLTFWAANSRLDSRKRRQSPTSYDTRNQALLYEPIPYFNHSGLGTFVCSSLPRCDHPHEKCPLWRVAFAGTTGVPP